MGRFKKSRKLETSDLWERSGGIESIIDKLLKADVLKRNTEYSSDVWSRLAIDLFDDDTPNNRHWLWRIWTKNSRGLREKVHLAAGERWGEDRNGTGDQVLQVEHIYEEVDTQCDTETLERQRALDSEDLHTDPEGPKSTHEAMKVQEGEPRENVLRRCPQVKKSFFITMSRKLWAKISPQKGTTALRGPWTDRVYDIFKEKNPCCTLAFKYQHVKVPRSRKKNLPFLKLKAVCTFPSCPAKYCFTMSKKPAAVGQDVKMLVQQTGEILHKLSEKKARPATHLKRGKIAKALMHALHSTPNEQLLAGNMTECLNKNMLKVLRSEMRKRKSVHSDVFMEIQLLQTLLKECATKYYKIPGYIQFFSTDPFIVHLYTECGLSILVHHLRSRSPVSLYLDATGGVVSKIPDQPNRVLYYALVLPGKTRDTPPLPICEMLSNDHSEPAITFWLMQFTLHLSKYTQIKIHHVETDYSWALIESAMIAFNERDISCYLNRAYELCMGKKSWDEMKPYTILHICSEQILKSFRQAISRQTDDKGLRDFVTFAFARLQTASNMTKSTTVVRALCALLTTPQNTNLVKESLCVLQSVISRSNEDTLEENTQPKDMSESEDRRHATSITGRSPFSVYFHQVMQEVKEQVAGDESWSVKEDNPYFCPGIITVLFKTYLAIFPLWSGLLLGDLSRYESHEQDLVTTKTPKTRDTNCHVKKWFGIVKHSVMQKEKKGKPGTFIRQMHQSLQERYMEHIIQHKLPPKLLLQPEPPLNLKQSQETCMKKNLPQKPFLKPEPPVNLDQSQETCMKKNLPQKPFLKPEPPVNLDQSQETCLKKNLPRKPLLKPEPRETPMNLDQSQETCMKKNLPQTSLRKPEPPVNLKKSQETCMKKNLPQTSLRKPEPPVNLDQSQETCMKKNLPQKPLLEPEPPVNLDQSQETWMKKNLPQKLLLKPEPCETPVNLDESQETWMKKNLPQTSLRKPEPPVNLKKSQETCMKKNLPQTSLRKPEPPVNLDQSQETCMKKNLPQKPFLKPEPRETPVNLIQSQETWKVKEESIKSEFYSVPKKRRLNVTQSKKNIICHTSQLPVEILHVDEEVDVLWNKPSTELIVAILRCPRQDQQSFLYHREFQTLRPHEWLYEETIKFYVSALLKKKGVNLYQLSHNITGVILHGTREQMLRNQLKKVNFEEYDGLITFVNINNSHWRFVYLHAKSDCIYVLDSLKGINEMEKATEACQKFQDFFTMRSPTPKNTDWAKKSWNPGTIKHPFQEDAYNCGVFVMLMTKQVVEEFPKIPDRINITPSMEMMCHYRKNMAKDILLASVSRDEYCCMCGQTQKAETDELSTWLRCESCNRCFHVRCLIITVPPEEQAWVCELCW